MRLAGTQELRIQVADGVRLNIRHRPGTRRPAFLLVHGLSSNARSWDEVTFRLAAEQHPTYAVDLRGHGESDSPDDGYDTATVTSDIAAVAAALGLGGAVVAGHSWGASIALRLAAERPALVEALALVDGGWIDPVRVDADMREKGVKILMSMQRTLRGRTTPAAVRSYLRAAHPGWSDAMIEAHMGDMRVAPDGLLSPRLPEPHLTSIIDGIWDEHPHQWYPSVTVPVMLLPAVHSEYPVWERQLRDWVGGAEAALRDATVRWYTNSDHYIQCEHPDRLATDLLDLAGRVTP